MTYDFSIENGRMLIGGKLTAATLTINNGAITKICKSPCGADITIDAKNCLLIPGVIDAHVHFREPGFANKEDWSTGSRAAAAGGVTTVLDMPNTLPPTTDARTLDEKRKLAKKSCVDFGFHLGATSRNISGAGSVPNIASVKFYLAETTGPLLFPEGLIRSALETLKGQRLPGTFHCESMVGLAKDRSFKYLDDARPEECEIKSADKVIAEAKKTGGKAHICHVSSARTLDMIREAKEKGTSITCEATPHHLFLDKSAEKGLGALARMNPPLRSKPNRDGLWRRLDSIDIIATDHAPHTIEEKERENPPAGVPGVETMLPLLLNAVNEGRLSIKKLVNMTSEKPASIFGISKKGAIAEGFDADITIVDMKKRMRVDNDKLHTKCGWSPFHGAVLKGWPVKTIVRGSLVFDEEPCQNSGREVKFRADKPRTN